MNHKQNVCQNRQQPTFSNGQDKITAIDSNNVSRQTAPLSGVVPLCLLALYGERWEDSSAPAIAFVQNDKGIAYAQANSGIVMLSGVKRSRNILYSIRGFGLGAR